MRDKILVKRQELLDYIVEFRGKHNMSPTMQQMAVKIYGDEKNAGNVKTMLIDPLIEEGFLYKAGGAKSIMLVTPQPREVYYRRESEKETVT